MNNNFSNTSFTESLENSNEKIHYLGDLRIVGQVVNNISDKDPIGYVVMTEKTQKFKMYTVEQTMSLIRRFKFVNAEIEDNKIVNTECSMTRMPKFNTHMNVIDNFGIIILGEIISNNKTIGYRAMDTNAKIVDIKENDIITLSFNNVNLINAKIVEKNNKHIVSAIKTEFTKIEKKNLDKLKQYKKVLTKEDKWRHSKHVEKYNNYILPKALKYIFGFNKTAFNSILYSRINNTNPYVDFDRVDKILLNEVYTEKNGCKLSNDDIKLLKRIIKEVQHKKYIGYDSNQNYIDFIPEEQYFYFACLAQFSLYNADVRKSFLNKKLFRKYNVSVYDTIVLTGYASNILLKTKSELDARIKEYNIKLESAKNAMYKEFKTKTFVNAEDIAQLGFAVNEKNRGYKFVTKTTLTKKLSFVGDYLLSGEIYRLTDADYNRYMKLSRCLGDILTIAAIHKLLNKLEYSVATSVDGEIKNVKSYLPNEVMTADIEMLIAIAYIYSSKAVFTYVNENLSKLDMLGIEIPSFEELSSMDYKLSPDLKMYFASGFNVWYRDDYNYKHKYLSEAEIINYRQLGVRHNIRHEMLQGELASIVNMVTSENCSASLIEENIGKLRFF